MKESAQKLVDWYASNSKGLKILFHILIGWLLYPAHLIAKGRTAVAIVAFLTGSFLGLGWLHCLLSVIKKDKYTLMLLDGFSK